MRYQIYLYRAPGGTQLNQSLSPFPLLSLILHLTISLFSIFSILLNVYGGWFLVQLNSWNNNAQFTTCHGNQKRIFLLEVPKGPSLCKQRGNWTSLLVVKAHNFLLIFWIPNGAHLSNKYNFFFFFISSVNNTACFPPLLFLAPFPQKTQLFLFVSLCNSIENHKTY